MEVSERPARTRAIIGDTVFPAHRLDSADDDWPLCVARVVSDVSVLCPLVGVKLDNIFLSTRGEAEDEFGPQCGPDPDPHLKFFDCPGGTKGDSGDNATTRGITATLAVAGHPGSIAAGPDALWVALNGDPGEPVRDRPLLRLDPSTGTTAHTGTVDLCPFVVRMVRESGDRAHLGSTSSARGTAGRSSDVGAAGSVS
jgi:hypothetical protein